MQLLVGFTGAWWLVWYYVTDDVFKSFEKSRKSWRSTLKYLIYVRARFRFFLKIPLFFPALEKLFLLILLKKGFLYEVKPLKKRINRNNFSSAGEKRGIFHDELYLYVYSVNWSFVLAFYGRKTADYTTTRLITFFELQCILGTNTKVCRNVLHLAVKWQNLVLYLLWHRKSSRCILWTSLSNIEYQLRSKVVSALL